MTGITAGWLLLGNGRVSAVRAYQHNLNTEENRMSNGKAFFADLLTETPVERTLTYGGVSKKVYFRRINGAERLALTSSQKFLVGGEGSKPTMEMSLQDALRKNQQLVQMASVDQDGKKLFKNLDEVQAMPAQLVEAIAKLAEEVNREVEEVGKD